MVINVSFDNGGNEEKKTIEIPVRNVIRGVTHLGVLSFIGREVNHIRPPKRNIGLVFNWMTAFAVTDAVMEIIFPKEKEVEVDKEEVKCEAYSEVKDDLGEAGDILQ